MQTPNQLVNSVCIDYHNGTKLPGYNNNSCSYYIPSDDVPIRCGIGSLLTDETAKGLEHCTQTVGNILRGKSLPICGNITLIAIEELTNLLNHPTFFTESGILNEEGITFFSRLQDDHDSFFSVPSKEQTNIGEYIWIKMNQKYPDLITQHFLK